MLNADNERLVEMASLCDGQVIFFAVDGQNPPWWRIVRLADELFLCVASTSFWQNGAYETRCINFNSPAVRDGASHQPGRYGGFARRVRGRSAMGITPETDHCRR